MNYLLDTNVFINLIEESFDRLSQTQREVISKSESIFWLSESSLYEIAIKVRLEKSDFSHINISTIEDDRQRLNIRLLKPKVVHYLNIPEVPKVYLSPSKLHADPFDLLIISQALIEDLPILSTDRYFPDYEGLRVIT
jgi:PIN domain nuclease of toxin-antitoxin system